MIVTIIYRVHGRRVKLMRANGASVVWVQAHAANYRLTFKVVI